MAPLKRENQTFAESGISKNVHIETANNAHFTTLTDWYVSTSLNEEQLLDLDYLINKHADKIGLTPDLNYLGSLDEETYRLLKRIDEAYDD